MHNHIRKVVIAGRDAAAWLSANALMRAFGATGLSVVVVELPSSLRPHDVYTTLPALEAFHTLLGFEENALLRASAGVFSLGQSFANFSGPRPAFFHPYGSHGASIGRLPFMQVWIKARQGGLKLPFEDFSLNAAAAKQGRFFVPDAETRAYGRSDYAYHLAAQPYVQYLKAQALQRDVTCIPARVFEAHIDAAGDIAELRLGDGQSVTGDLFIDATGTESLLLGQAMQSGFESWAQWFPFNRQITAAADPLKVLPAYSQVRALGHGCLHLAPVQSHTTVVHAYDSRKLSDDEALQSAAVVSNMRLHDGAVLSELKPGRRKDIWRGNCIAVGEAAAQFDPIDHVSLHGLQLGLAHLIALFPLDKQAVVERTDYNAIMALSLEHLRDFQMTHYRFNRRFGETLWDEARGMTVPERLAYRAEIFAASGRIPRYDEESFETDNWRAILLGHEIMPQSYDMVVDMTPDDEAIGRVQAMLAFIRRQVETMSTMNEYLSRNGAALTQVVS